MTQKDTSHFGHHVCNFSGFIRIHRCKKKEKNEETEQSSIKIKKISAYPVFKKKINKSTDKDVEELKKEEKSEEKECFKKRKERRSKIKG